jgi:hypothetical protein
MEDACHEADHSMYWTGAPATMTSVRITFLFITTVGIISGCGSASEVTSGSSGTSPPMTSPTPAPMPTPAPAPSPSPSPAPSPSANNGLPFASGVETGDFSEWNGFGVNGAITIASQQCTSGAYCARIQLTQGTHSDGYAEHRFGDFYNIGLAKVEEVYLRLFSRFDSGYVWPNDSQKIAVLNLTDGTSSLRLSSILGSSSDSPRTLARPHRFAPTSGTS